MEVSNATAVIERTETDQLPLAPRPEVAASPVLSMLHDAIQRGMSIDVIREIRALAKEVAADEARRAFDAAIAEAKGEIPIVRKNREVDFTSQKGRTHYKYEDFAEVARTVDPILNKHGLSYRFRVASPPNEPVSVTCVLAHRDGYSEEVTISAGRDDSGNKNHIQAIASTVTYLQRITLKASLGLAASEHDDDGAGATQDTSTITDEQRDTLLKLIADVGGTVEVFCKYFKIEAVGDLLASQYERAVAAVEAKRPKP